MNQLTVMLNNNHNNTNSSNTANNNTSGNNGSNVGNHGQQQPQQYFTFGQTIQQHQGPTMSIQADPNHPQAQQQQLVTYQHQQQPQGTTIMVGSQAYTTQPSINQQQQSQHQQPGAIQYFIAPSNTATTFQQQQLQQCQPTQQQLLSAQTTQQPFGLMQNLITPGVSMFPLQQSPQHQNTGTIQLQQSPQQLITTQNGTLQQQQQPTFLAMTNHHHHHLNQSTGTIQIQTAGANGNNNGATTTQLFTQQQQQPQIQHHQQHQPFHIIGSNQSAIQINQNQLQQQLQPQIITNAAGQQFILNPGQQQGQIVNANTSAPGTNHLIATTGQLNQQQQQPQAQQQIYQIVLPNGQVIQTVQPTISNTAGTTLISPQQIQFQPHHQAHQLQPQQLQQPHLLQTQQLTVPIQQQQQLHQSTILGPNLTLQQSGQPTFIQHQPQQHLVQIGQPQLINCNTPTVQYTNTAVRDTNYQLANLTGTLPHQQQQATHSPTLILTTGPAAVSPSVPNQSIHLIQTQNTGSSSNLLIPARSMSTSSSSSTMSAINNHNAATANNHSSTTAMVVLTQSPIALPPTTCASSSTSTTGTAPQLSSNATSLMPNSVLDHKSIQCQPIVSTKQTTIGTDAAINYQNQSHINNSNKKSNANSRKKTTSSQQNHTAVTTAEMVSNNNSESSSLTTSTITNLAEGLSENVQKITDSFRPPSVGQNVSDSTVTDADKGSAVGRNIVNTKHISECLTKKPIATTTTTIATMTDGDISKFEMILEETLTPITITNEFDKTAIDCEPTTAPPSPSPSCSSTGSLRIAIDDEEDDNNNNDNNNDDGSDNEDNDIDDDDDDDDDDEDTEEGSNDNQEGQQQLTKGPTIDNDSENTENDGCSTETEIDNETVANQTEEEEGMDSNEMGSINVEDNLPDQDGENNVITFQQESKDLNPTSEPNQTEQNNLQSQLVSPLQLKPILPQDDKEGYQSSYGGSPCHFTDTEDEEEEEDDEDEEAEVCDNLENGNEIKLVRGKNGLTKAAYNLINNRILGSEDDNATNASMDSSKNSLISVNEELCSINNQNIDDNDDVGATMDDSNQNNNLNKILIEIETSLTPSPVASIASSSGSGLMEPESTTQNLLVSSTKVSNLIEKTINNTIDVRIIDGVNLDEIKDFAKAFKLCRLSLGLTQSQVGHELSALNGPCYSQSAICRFEKLDITPKSAKKIKPVLQNWMRDAEKKHRISKLAVCSGGGSGEMNDSNNNNTTASELNDSSANGPLLSAAIKENCQNESFFKMNGLEFVMNSLNNSKSLSSEIISSLNISLDPGKKRKRRTSFSHATIDALNNFFEKNPRPSSQDMTKMSDILNQDRDVIRVWFCNKRQALRAKKPNNQSNGGNGDISSGGDLSQDSNQSQSDYPSIDTASVPVTNNNSALSPVSSQPSSATSNSPKVFNQGTKTTTPNSQSTLHRPSHFPSLSSIHHHAGTIKFPSCQPTSSIPLSLSSSSTSSSSSSMSAKSKMVKFSSNYTTATKSSSAPTTQPASNSYPNHTTNQNQSTSIRLYPTVSVTHHGNHHQTSTTTSQPNQFNRIQNGILSQHHLNLAKHHHGKDPNLNPNNNKNKIGTDLMINQTSMVQSQTSTTTAIANATNNNTNGLLAK